MSAIVRAGQPSRRQALLLGAGLAAGITAGAAGCTVQNPLDDAETPARKAVPDLSPDVAVAVEAVVAIRATRRLVGVTARRHPGLRAPLQGLVDMHEAHLEALVDAVPDRVDTSGGEQPPPVDQRPPAARQQVLQRERRLHDQITGLALRAESGSFARLLGSVAASISQHRAALVAS